MDSRIIIDELSIYDNAECVVKKSAKGNDADMTGTGNHVSDSSPSMPFDIRFERPTNNERTSIIK